MKPASLSTLQWAAATALALAACGPTPYSPPPPAALAPRACLDLESAPELPIPWTLSETGPGGLSVPNSPNPARILAGGTIASGDFRIGIWLYCDPLLVGTDPFSPDTSEIALLGLHYAWMYLGPPREGDTETTVTANGVVIRQSGSGPGLSRGSAETSTGRIQTENGAVARAAAEGQPIELVLTVRGEGYEQAARLEVVFEATADGYVLRHASLGP
jgi:hypothetical protein